MAGYSNLRAMRALVKASLQSIFKSPSAVVFGIAFPLIFILVFGFLGGSRSFNIEVVDAPGTDTSNALYSQLHQLPVLKWIEGRSSEEINRLMREGDIVATVMIEERQHGTPQYSILLNGSSSNTDQLAQLQSLLQQTIQNLDPEIKKRTEQIADIDVIATDVREFTAIDFILPGQLGFSLLAGSVFGTAFVFFNMRQTLVLKRFFATPVRKEVIVLSEGIARMIFQLLSAIIIIAIGYYAFDYTLVHGMATFFQLLALSAIAIMVFMGFGFIVSSLAKNEAAIPPFSNLITLPQFLLAGTFFSIDNFPKWLQPFCRILPLSYLNDAMRKVAFDGANLWDVRLEIFLLLLWGIVLYTIAGKVFRWE